MILVVRTSDKKILSRYEAWAQGAQTEALKFIQDNGYKVVSDEITLMGDMIIWVA